MSSEIGREEKGWQGRKLRRAGRKREEGKSKEGMRGQLFAFSLNLTFLCGHSAFSVYPLGKSPAGWVGDGNWAFPPSRPQVLVVKDPLVEM
jgi:hypothetical protein